ncbi:MAG: sulfatase-like hydrolase/transferase [Kiritimatiellae bacterium]|nr:sulfatase-like hydrolase/transferase [Kiritimatiellia bacterium]
MNETADSRPNILIFLVDEVQQDVTLPAHPCRMPVLKAFAQDGVAFTSTFCPSPHCCPSRATVMTGLYPTRHGVFNNVNTRTAFQRGLNPGVKLFSEYLKGAGYHLAYAGKWHVSDEDTPGDRGWEELTPFRKHWLSRSLADWDKRAAEPEPAAEPRGDGTILRTGWGNVSSRGTVDDAPDAYEQSRWYQGAVLPGIRALPDLARRGGPWCLCISTDLDHQNSVPRAFADLYDPAPVELPASFHDLMRDKPRVYERMRHHLWGQLTEAEVRRGMAHYWALCSLQDRYFEEILAALEQTGQARNTLVVFVGDHGDCNYAHGLCNMGIHAFRESYHVPCIMRWPDGIRNPGRAVDEFVSLADLAPTFLALAGTEPKERLTGRSLLAFLRGEPTPADWPDAWYSQTKGNEVYYTQRVVQTRKWKYVANWFDFDELYDLENDPHELTNLAFPTDAARATSNTGESGTSGMFMAWPPLSPELDAVRRELLAKMWRFARREEDIIFNAYPPVALAAYGPLIGLRG